MVTDYEATMRRELRIITNIKGNLGKLPDRTARLRVLSYLTSVVVGETGQAELDFESQQDGEDDAA